MAAPDLSLIEPSKTGDFHTRVMIEESWDGTRDFVWFDADGNPTGYQTQCDLTPIVESAKELANDGSNGFGKSKEWKHVARVHPSLLIDWAAKRGVPVSFLNTKEGFEEIVMRYINDPDYRHLRVSKR